MDGDHSAQTVGKNVVGSLNRLGFNSSTYHWASSSASVSHRTYLIGLFKEINETPHVTLSKLQEQKLKLSSIHLVLILLYAFHTSSWSVYLVAG